MDDDQQRRPDQRVNFAYVAGSWSPGVSVLPPLSDAAESHRLWLSRFAEDRAMPLGTEDLDRGDNERQQITAEGNSRLRMIARTIHASAGQAFDEAVALTDELAAAGYQVRPTSRLGAAVATGPEQEAAGWRALLDLSLLHPDE